MKKILPLALLFIPSLVFSQDDLLKQLQSQSPPKKEPVIATFKGFKIINIQTNETTKKRNLDFRVSHLFGNIGKQSGGGIHNFYGLDASIDIRIGFHYGITDKLTVGFAHIKNKETFEGIAKLRVLEQQTGGGMPFAVTLYGEATASIRDKKAFPQEDLGKMAHRFNYCTQVILARKFNSRFSFLLAPSWVHRNIVPDSVKNELISIGAGFRLKFTRSSALVADYFYNVWPKSPEGHRDPLGIGVEIETGGHVFTIMFTNASGLAEDEFIPYTQDSWDKGGVKLSFNISRMFAL